MSVLRAHKVKNTPAAFEARIEKLVEAFQRLVTEGVKQHKDTTLFEGVGLQKPKENWGHTASDAAEALVSGVPVPFVGDAIGFAAGSIGRAAADKWGKHQAEKMTDIAFLDEGLDLSAITPLVAALGRIDQGNKDFSAVGKLAKLVFKECIANLPEAAKDKANEGKVYQVAFEKAFETVFPTVCNEFLPAYAKAHNIKTTKVKSFDEAKNLIKEQNLSEPNTQVSNEQINSERKIPTQQKTK